jgi:RNA polymerase sigma factor (sigma-70 family)
MGEATATAGLSRLLSDDRLTRRAVGGDQRAFAAIFRRYHQPLYRFCLAFVGNPDDAQEALQNTMAKVLRALPGEEREIDLKPWLYRIAHNESVDLLRRRRETRELDVEQVAPGYGLAEDAETRDRLRRLLDDLRELPERQREALVMRELSGLDFEEIGAALDTSGAAARQTLYEARQSLRQMDEGREMSCAAVTKALSDGDGRVVRRRDVRAHLRACPSCRRFREEIKDREHSLAALAPLPAVAAAAMLHGLLGGVQGGGVGGGLAATLGGGAAKAVGASAAVKGVATVAVVAAIGVTAADKSGVIHLGMPGDQPVKTSDPAPAGRGSQGARDVAAGTGEGGSGTGQQFAAAEAGSQVKVGSSRSQGQAEDTPTAAAPGSSTEHPSGPGHEKQHPATAAHGQETAAAHQPQGEAKGVDNGNGGAAESEDHGQAALTLFPPSIGRGSDSEQEQEPADQQEESAAPRQSESHGHGPPEGTHGAEVSAEKKQS